jgi:hypothetical protein
MEDHKRKELESKLRQMIVDANSSQDKITAFEPKPRNIMVIRRRKGQPDRRIVK